MAYELNRLIKHLRELASREAALDYHHPTDDSYWAAVEDGETLLARIVLPQLEQQQKRQEE